MMVCYSYFGMISAMVYGVHTKLSPVASSSSCVSKYQAQRTIYMLSIMLLKKYKKCARDC